MRTIDIHTHVLTEETIGLLQKESSKIAPKLTPIDADFSVLDVAGVPYRPFPRGGFDIDRRFAVMAAAEVEVQVLSATPQTYYYDQESSLAAACAALQNDQIANLVKAYPDRIYVPNSGSDTVDVIDPHTFKVIDHFAVVRQ